QVLDAILLDDRFAPSYGGGPQPLPFPTRRSSDLSHGARPPLATSVLLTRRSPRARASYLRCAMRALCCFPLPEWRGRHSARSPADRKSTRLNSSHLGNPNPVSSSNRKIT